MNIIKQFSITNCDVSDIITELNRYLFHIVLLHIATYALDQKETLFGNNLLKIILATVVAVVIYHVVFKKIVLTKLKEIQFECKKNNNESTSAELKNGRTIRI